jgi:hypothetical protein
MNPARTSRRSGVARDDQEPFAAAVHQFERRSSTKGGDDVSAAGGPREQIRLWCCDAQALRCGLVHGRSNEGEPCNQDEKGA